MAKAPKAELPWEQQDPSVGSNDNPPVIATQASAEGSPEGSSGGDDSVAPSELQSPAVVNNDSLIAEADEFQSAPTVTVIVPKDFKLRLDDHQELQFKAGVQEMREDYANHWWSKANSVQIYKPS